LHALGGEPDRNAALNCFGKSQRLVLDTGAAVGNDPGPDRLGGL